MKPVSFVSPIEFRKWLAVNHKKKDEILIQFYKKGSGKASMGIEDAQMQVLCFGWIDGILRNTGPETFVLRFTPRHKGSLWSEVNIRRANNLIKQGLMQPAGLKAFEERDIEKARFYSYEQRSKGLSKGLEAQFKKQKEAWKFFSTQPPGYQRTITFWVMSAKREETQRKRLARLIEMSAKNRRVDLLAPFGKKV
jgi:uncharacterized protein YdeI (YjbR/CyaY-like superfamily)